MNEIERNTPTPGKLLPKSVSASDIVQYYRAPTPLLPAAAATIERYGADATGLARAFAPHLQGDFARNPDLCMTDKRVPQLSVAANAYGRNAVVGWLIGQLEDLFRMAGARTASDLGAIQAAAEAVLTAYPSLRLTDIMLFLTRFKAGVYGRFYGQTDPLVVTEALGKYWDERAAALRRIDAAAEKVRGLMSRLDTFGEVWMDIDQLRASPLWAIYGDAERRLIEAVALRRDHPGGSFVRYTFRVRKVGLRADGKTPIYGIDWPHSAEDIPEDVWEQNGAAELFRRKSRGQGGEGENCRGRPI